MNDQTEIQNPELKALADQDDEYAMNNKFEAEQDKDTQDDSATQENIERARENARLVIAGLEKLFKFKEPRIEFDDDIYIKSETALAPALAKNSLQLPGWLEKYREEIRASVFVGGVIFSSVMTIKALRDEDAEKEKETKLDDTVKASVFPDDDELESKLEGVFV